MHIFSLPINQSNYKIIAHVRITFYANNFKANHKHKFNKKSAEIYRNKKYTKSWLIKISEKKLQFQINYLKINIKNYSQERLKKSTLQDKHKINNYLFIL